MDQRSSSKLCVVCSAQKFCTLLLRTFKKLSEKMAGTIPLLSRKLDTLYFVFFVIHVPVMLLIDLAPFYSDALTPSISLTIREYYITSYRDRFFLQPPAWFKVYIALEGLYHLPITLWMLPALSKDDSLVPLHLLVFAVETGVTTLTCLVEMLSWEGYTSQELVKLSMLYGPYLAFAVLMGADSFTRLRRTLSEKLKSS